MGVALIQFMFEQGLSPLALWSVSPNNRTSSEQLGEARQGLTGLHPHGDQISSPSMEPSKHRGDSAAPSAAH